MTSIQPRDVTSSAIVPLPPAATGPCSGTVYHQGFVSTGWHMVEGRPHGE